MKRIAAAALASAFVATIAAAQMKPVPAGAPGSPVRITRSDNQMDHIIASARRLTREDAIKMVREGKAVFVDVRSKESYDKGHIKGAISIPGSQILQRINDVPPGKMAITYCACVEEHSAAVAVVKLNQAGFHNTAALVGGWNEWVDNKLPIAKSK